VKKLIIGHRGAGLPEPENTLRSFFKAMEIGADGIEFDLRLTSDGNIVVIHDKYLDRTTTGHGAVGALKLKELQRLDAGLGEKIPTFDEVISAFGHKTLLNAELKETGFEDEVTRMVKKFSIMDRFIASSSDTVVIKRLHEIEPSMRKALLISDMSSDLLQSAIDLRISAIHPSLHCFSRELLEKATRHGLDVIVWTVNDESAATELFSWGVKGIITDKAQSMVLLRERMNSER
jgi:glycerophosphoryl diester phosphodiesterase